MRLYPLIVLLTLLVACSQRQSIVLVNKTSSSFYNQPLVFKRADFNVEKKDFLIFLDDNENPIPAQFDDIDDDGYWDEVALALNFEPSEELQLVFQIVSERQLPKFENMTAAHLGYSPGRDGQFNSVDENIRPKNHLELVAFRTYFDSRNGKDTFGKTKPQLYASEIGLKGSYHELQDWGMDILKVGNSLGSGAIAILKNDSIYRLTDTENATFKILTQGPVRTIIALSYEGWKVADTTYDLKETIHIWAGKRHYQSELRLSGNGQDTLITGIVNLKGMEAKTVDGMNSKMLYTHGKQSENKDILGMGLIVPKDGLIAFSAAPEFGEGVTNTYTALLKPVNGVYQYSFYVGWELENSKFKEEQGFVNALKSETTLLYNPIEMATQF
jgi:hypothetical protein